MLAAALTIASAILAAFSVLVAAAFPRLHAFELFFISPSLGLSVSAWIAFALKSLPGAGHGFSPSVVWGTIGVQVAIGLIAARWSVPALTANIGRIRAELRTHRASLYFLAALSAWWFYMSHIHYLFRRGSDHIAGGSVYADLPFHLNIASSFLSGANEAKGITDTLTSTFYAGAPLAYPFIPDFYLAVLYAGGMDWHDSLTATGGLLLSSLTALAYALNVRILGSMRGASLALVLAICTGGLGGFYYIWSKPDWWTPANLTSQEFIHGKDHVLYWVPGAGHRSQAFWYGMVAHILFPQRTVQHAYPLALSALLVLWVAGTSLALGGAQAPPLDAPALVPAPAPAPAAPTDSAATAPLSSSDDAAAKGSAKRRRNPKGGASATAARDDSDDGSKLARYYFAPALALPTLRERLALFALGGVLTGLLPLMQPHSFLSVGIIALVLAAGLFAERLVCAALRVGGATWGGAAVFFCEWALYGAVALGLAWPQLAKHFMHRVGPVGLSGGSQGFVRFITAWAEEGVASPVDLVWNATGIFVPCCFLSLLLLRRPSQAFFLAGLAALFVVAHTVMLQPWHWDNTKCLVIFTFCAAGYVGALLDWLLRATGNAAGRPWFPAAVLVATAPPPLAAVARAGALSVLRVLGLAAFAALFFTLSISGALCTWREMLNNAKTYDDADFDYAAWIVNNTPPDAVFMNDFVKNTNHIRVESSLAGRQVAVGFLGWLTSHGINYGARRSALAGVMSSRRASVRALAAEGISHITVDPSSTRVFDTAFLDTFADYEATSGKYSAWKVLPSVRTGAYSPDTKCEGAPGDADRTACISAGCWHFAADGQGPRCVKAPRKRPVVECPAGVFASRDACADAGCLWFEGFTGGPWCQAARYQLESKGRRPALIPMLRPGVPGSDCGWPTMSPADCNKRGCDWRQPTDGDAYAPWCVYRDAGQA